MSDNTEFFNEIMVATAHANAQPKIAMTFKNKSNFSCSLVARDQNFYADIQDDQIMMDFEDSLEAELEDSMIPQALKRAKETSEGFITMGDLDYGLPLTDDLAAICEQAFAPCEDATIAQALEVLEGSDLAREYIAFANTNNITIALNNFIDRMDINFDHNMIDIPQAQNTMNIALNIVRGIRAIQMSGVRDLLKNPDRAILLNRSMQAELACAPIQVAWEIKLSGDERAWDLVSTSAIADLAYAFAHRASDDFRSIRDGRAAIAAFDQWFYSGRTRKADRALIQVLLASSDEVAEANETSNSEAIEALRSVGKRSNIGRNYLVDHFMTLLEDGFYGEVRDRSNANFMWFVKFERSFREAEVKMQTGKARVSEQSPQNGGAIVLSFPTIKHDRRRTKRVEAQAQVHTLRV